MKPHFFATFIAVLWPIWCFSQAERLDSMKQILTVQAGSDRLYTLLNLSYQYYEYDIQAAYNYATEALSLAQKLKNRAGEVHALSLIGEYYYNVNDLNTARDWFRQSAAIEVKNGGTTYAGYNEILWANTFFQEAQNDSARIHYEKGLFLLKNTDNYDIRHYANIDYATFLVEQRQSDQARKILNEAYDQAMLRHSKDNQADVLIELSRLENTVDEYQKAKDCLTKVAPLLPGPGYSYLRLAYFYQLGSTEYNLGNYVKAITQMRALLSTKEIGHYEDLQAKVNALIGKIYLYRGEFDFALKSYLDALKTMERLNMRLELGQLYGEIAWLYFKQFNDPETVVFAGKAMKMGLEIGDNLGVGHAHSVLGSLYTTQKKYDKALKEHKQALEIRKRSQSRSGISESYYNIATVYEKEGNIQQAVMYAEQSLEIDKALGNLFNLGLSYKKVASLYILMGKYSEAQTFLILADTCAQKTRSLELRRDIDLIFADLYEKGGDFKKATEYLHKAFNSNDSLYNVLNAEKTAEIRGLFDLENIELKSKQRAQELAFQRIEMEKQQNYYIFAKIILFLVSLFSLVSAYGYYKSWKSNLKLKAEIAERKKAEAQNIQSRLKLEEAQALTHVGNWEFQLATGAMSWSKETYRIFDLENHPDEGLYEAWRAKCHPDDLAKVEEGIRQTIKTGGPFTVEHRAVFEDGSVKYINCIGEAIKDAQGNVIGLKGTDQDITLQKLADLAKSEFLSSMSHEIRTPINGVIGIANLLQGEKLTPTQQEYVHTLKFSAQHLSSIVSDILDFSKIESGNVVFENLPFNLRDLAHNVFKLFETQAGEKQLRYDFNPDTRITNLLSGDYVRLIQVLSNLLSNAIKFTEKGAVEFAYVLEESTEQQVRVLFTIKDSGIGIAAEQTKQIFDNFYQADASISRKYGGTGLGLTISKKLVEQQGGKISVESQMGIGSVFTVELLFATVPESTNTDAAPTVEVKQDLSGMRILVADDNTVNILVITPLLRRWGAEYTVARDGLEALECIKQADFDAVIMDIQMPNMDGREAMLAIRKISDARKRSIPIIAFTAEGSLDLQEDLIHLGFDDCLTKPFQPEKVLETLRRGGRGTVDGGR
ncbi:tetratricopeptide repeat protein [Runella sp.]|uniref:tetratricopeptide repeat protein n=1 Tax=Runella sp. TaxID=1960881 RepID=UPI0030169019